MNVNRSAVDGNSTDTLQFISDDFFVTVVWTLLLSYGLVANMLILVGIFRSQTMRQATSYWLIISLAVCDVMMILISLLHLVPSTYLHDDYFEVDSLRNVYAIFVYDIFWYTGVLKLGLMALNRFASIVYPMEYKLVFSPRRTAAMIALMYAGGLAVSVPILLPCCGMKWDHRIWLTVYDPEDSPHAYVDMSVNGLSVLVMLYCYAVVIRKVRASSTAMAKYRLRLQQKHVEANSSSSASVPSRTPSLHPPSAAHVSKRELRLFLQFFIVSLVFLVTWSTWQWLPYVSLSKWIYFSGTSFFFLNNAVNPSVYLVFNTALRREVRNFVCRHEAGGGAGGGGGAAAGGRGGVTCVGGADTASNSIRRRPDGGAGASSVNIFAATTPAPPTPSTTLTTTRNRGVDEHTTPAGDVSRSSLLNVTYEDRAGGNETDENPEDDSSCSSDEERPNRRRHHRHVAAINAIVVTLVGGGSAAVEAKLAPHAATADANNGMMDKGITNERSSTV